MSAHCVCPHCDAILADTPIPVDSMHHYGGVQGVPADCPDGCGRPRHYSRIIGIYDRGLDRTVAWMCPDCNTGWPR